MLFNWILTTRYHRSYESSVKLTSGLGSVCWSRNYSAESMCLIAHSSKSIKGNKLLKMRDSHQDIKKKFILSINLR